MAFLCKILICDSYLRKLNDLIASGIQIRMDNILPNFEEGWWFLSDSMVRELTWFLRAFLFCILRLSDIIHAMHTQDWYISVKLCNAYFHVRNAAGPSPWKTNLIKHLSF